MASPLSLPLTSFALPSKFYGYHSWLPRHRQKTSQNCLFCPSEIAIAPSGWRATFEPLCESVRTPISTLRGGDCPSQASVDFIPRSREHLDRVLVAIPTLAISEIRSAYCLRKNLLLSSICSGTHPASDWWSLIGWPAVWGILVREISVRGAVRASR